MTIQRFVESIYNNSDYADQNMCIILWRIIYAHFDITHQAHFTVSWKIWNSCHMCAYQENIMIFGFFEAISFCHTLISVAPIHLDGEINSSSFAFIFWNFQHSELCCKSRVIFKIAEKRLCCDFRHNLTLENGNFYKIVFCFPHN